MTENGLYVIYALTEVMMPTLRIVANPFVKRYGRTDSVAWTLPIDDTTTKIFTLYGHPGASGFRGCASTAGGGPSSPRRSISDAQ